MFASFCTIMPEEMQYLQRPFHSVDAQKFNFDLQRLTLDVYTHISRRSCSRGLLPKLLNHKYCMHRVSTDDELFLHVSPNHNVDRQNSITVI